jgi:TolB-like protein
MKFLQVILLFLLFGCESTNGTFLSELSEEEESILIESSVDYFSVVSKQNLFASHSSNLVTQLMYNKRFNYKNKPIAVTTFVWLDTLSFKQIEQPRRMFGHLLSESIKTELVKSGGEVLEFRSASALSISPDASYFLSRDLSELSNNVNVDYVLTGTLSEVDGGIWVHAEVIDIKTNKVKSAARQFFTNEVISSNENTSWMRNGRIFRGGSKRSL